MEPLVQIKMAESRERVLVEWEAAEAAEAAEATPFLFE